METVLGELGTVCYRVGSTLGALIGLFTLLARALVVQWPDATGARR